MFLRQTLALLLISTIYLNAQNYNISDFEDYIEREIARKTIVGLSVAVNDKGQEWTRSYGFADIENEVKSTSRSAYRLASITKPMTAVGILVLVQQGKIDLDAEVQLYVPYYPRKKWPVTVRQLLGHLSGISHYRNYQIESGTTEQMNTKKAISIFSNWELLHEPMAQYQYTTYGYNLLGAVIEGASGQTYEAFMRQYVWDPLNMSDTQLDHLFRLIPGRVRGYRLEQGEIINSRPVNTSLKFAGGGTRSTVLDMVRFARGLSQGKVLSESLRDSMWTGMVTSNGKDTYYGMGWGISDFNGRFMVQHGGGQEGTRTYLIHLPQHDVTVAVAANCEETDTRAVTDRLLAVFLNEPFTWPVIYSHSPENLIMQMIVDRCYRDGLAHYDNLRDKFHPNPEKIGHKFNRLNWYSSANLNEIGLDSVFQLIENDRHPSAGRIFRECGAAMAAEILQHNPGMNEVLFSEGPIAFFSHYLKSSDQPGLSKRWADKITQWVGVLENTWPDELKYFSIDPSDNPDAVRQKLKSVFSGFDMYPDFSEQLSIAAFHSLQADNLDKTRQWVEISMELYPESETANTTMGLLSLIEKDVENGLLYLRRALTFNPNGKAHQSRLNQFAYQLAAQNKIESGIHVLEAAIQLNPQVANLYDSKAELYLMRGDTTKSIYFYKQALEIDPGFENAQRMLEMIRKNQTAHQSNPDQ